MSIMVVQIKASKSGGTAIVEMILFLFPKDSNYLVKPCLTQNILKSLKVVAFVKHIFK